jgi:hypothetical protein
MSPHLLSFYQEGERYLALQCKLNIEPPTLMAFRVVLSEVRRSLEVVLPDNKRLFCGAPDVKTLAGGREVAVVEPVDVVTDCNLRNEFAFAVDEGLGKA